MLIKKYKTRKLYSPDLGRYVTLEELIQYTKEDKNFTVVSAESNVDITDRIKLNLIVELTKRALTNRAWNKEQLNERLEKLVGMI